MKRANYGYYSEDIRVSLRSDWVEKIDALVNQKNYYKNRQTVIRAAIKRFLQVNKDY